MAPEARQPAGVPAGGQYAPTSHREGEVTLTEDAAEAAPAAGGRASGLDSLRTTLENEGWTRTTYATIDEARDASMTGARNMQLWSAIRDGSRTGQPSGWVTDSGAVEMWTADRANEQSYSRNGTIVLVLDKAGGKIIRKVFSTNGSTDNLSPSLDDLHRAAASHGRTGKARQDQQDAERDARFAARDDRRARNNRLFGDATEAMIEAGFDPEALDQAGEDGDKIAIDTETFLTMLRRLRQD